MTTEYIFENSVGVTNELSASLLRANERRTISVPKHRMIDDPVYGFNHPVEDFSRPVNW